MEQTLLKIKDLTVALKEQAGGLPIVKGVSLEIPKGRVVGLVGESGCGKSMTAKSVNGILPPDVEVRAGQILWYGEEGEEKDLAALPETEIRKLCGREIGMVFQEPMTSLNPLMRVGDQVREVLLLHGLAASKEEAKARVVELFGEVGIPEPARRYNAWPHELSGGLRQRVVIAMAAVAGPKLLIADEATTALDVTIEAQILKLIRRMCESRGMSALVITHNMRVVARICDEVYVMYMGRIMEKATVRQLFANPLHPYTQGLLSSIPRIGNNPEYLSAIPGNIPELKKQIVGCEFCLRCSRDVRDCFFEKPELKEAEEDHFVRCHVCG